MNDQERLFAVAAFQKMVAGEEVTLRDAERVLAVVMNNIHPAMPGAADLAQFKNGLIGSLQKWQSALSQNG